MPSAHLSPTCWCFPLERAPGLPTTACRRRQVDLGREGDLCSVLGSWSCSVPTTTSKCHHTCSAWPSCIDWPKPGQAGPKLLHHNQPAIQPELKKENLEFNSNINFKALASQPKSETSTHDLASAGTWPLINGAERCNVIIDRIEEKKTPSEMEVALRYKLLTLLTLLTLFTLLTLLTLLTLFILLKLLYTA